MRLRSLRKENSKLKEMIETLEQIKDKFTEIHNMCRCDCVKNNPDEMNKLEFLMLKYEQLKNQEEEENIYQDEDESNEIVPLKNNTNSDSTDDGLKKKTKLRIVRKKGSRYSPLKKGRVGRPRKEEWPLFEQEKLLKATYVCTWEGCDKRYYYNAHLINHIRMHKGERPFVCEWPGCGKRYLTNSILVSHVRSAHKKDDKPDSDGDSRVKRLPYSCEFCGVNFRRRDQLDSHSSAVHSSAKPLQCDWPGCDFQTVHGQKLKMHKMRHTGEKPYKCNWPECEWSFRQQHHLKTHMLKHTGEKPHSCDWPGCERRFQSRQALRIHIDRNHKGAPCNLLTQQNVQSMIK